MLVFVSLFGVHVLTIARSASASITFDFGEHSTSSLLRHLFQEVLSFFCTCLLFCLPLDKKYSTVLAAAIKRERYRELPLEQDLGLQQEARTLGPRVGRSCSVLSVRERAQGLSARFCLRVGSLLGLLLDRIVALGSCASQGGGGFRPTGRSAPASQPAA